MPDDGHRDEKDADGQFDEPPEDEDGTEEDLEECFHKGRFLIEVWGIRLKGELSSTCACR